MGLETFLFQKKAWGRHNDCLLCKNLSSSIHDHWLQLHHVTITLWQQDILYCAIFNWYSMKRSSMKLTKLLVRCLNAPWKSFYVNLPLERLFLTFWKLIRSHAVTPRWLDDAKEFIQSGWGKQRDSCSLAHEIPAAVAGRFNSKAVFLENYLVVSTWILNGSSNCIECLKKKYQPFSLAGVRFGSLVNQISELKSAWSRSGLCLFDFVAT